MQASFIAQSQNQPTVTRGLVAYWTFNESTGSIVHDFSGNKNDGILSGSSAAYPRPSWTTGKIGPSLFFSGSGETLGGFITLNTGLNIANTGATICVWANPVFFRTGGSAYWFIGKDNNTVGRSYDFGIYNSTGNTYQYVAQLNGTYNFFGTTHPSIDGLWHHYAMVLNSSVMAFYHDGIADGTVTGIPSINQTSAQTLLGGRGYVTAQENFIGYLDDIRIYNVALTATEIQQIYNAHDT